MRISILILSIYILYPFSLISKQSKNNFEIVKVYYNNPSDKIPSNIFVVITKEIAVDTARMQSIICQINKSYPIDIAIVSFFLDKKHADFKDNLFSNSEYKQHCLALFETKSRAYVIYPYSSNSGKKKTYRFTSFKKCL